MDAKMAVNLRTGDVVVLDAGTEYEYRMAVKATQMTPGGKITIWFDDDSRITRPTTEWFDVVS